MHVERRPVSFTDARGEIRDIFPRDSPESVTLIVSKKGSARGNHYHRLSKQWAFVIIGRMAAYAKKMDEGAVERRVLEPGDIVVHEPNEAHEYVAEEDTVFLAFAEGARRGEDYEKDTYRIQIPLHEKWKARQPTD